MSRAQSLNDATEMQYGINVAREILMEPATGPAATLSERILACLDGKAAEADWNITIDPFGASFCETTEGALQWLHYGRGGTGYALGFATASLIGPQFVFRRVIYDTAKQRAIIREAIGLFQSALDLVPPQHVEAAAVACTAVLRVLATRMKDPCFRGEDEWRLVSWVISGTDVAADPGEPPQPTTRFRGGLRARCSLRIRAV